MTEERIKPTSPIAVIGAGSWGTALAVHLARTGRRTLLWSRDQDQAAAMLAARKNERYLPEIEFPEQLLVTGELEQVLGEARDILLAVPSQSFRATLESIARSAADLAGISWATKGFELETGLLPHQVAREVVAHDLPTAVLSGPTFAREVAAGLPSAMTVASRDERYAQRVAESVTTDTFRGYTSDDIVGVEIGGATKNIFAIGAGISDGIGFGANTRIALLTRGLAEMTRLGAAFGARMETFMGLAGMGDLVLTCTDNQSRNRRFGLALARGASIAQARASIGQVVEGYYAARSVHQVATRLGVDMPIAEQIYRVLYQGVDPRDAVDALMRRPVMRES